VKGSSGDKEYSGVGKNFHLELKEHLSGHEAAERFAERGGFEKKTREVRQVRKQGEFRN